VDEKKLEFPQFEPVQWELFVPFIVPLDNEESPSVPKVTATNVEALLPLFHFFGLLARAQESEKVLIETLPTTFYKNPVDDQTSFEDAISACLSRWVIAEELSMPALANSACQRFMNSFKFEHDYMLKIHVEHAKQMLVVSQSNKEMLKTLREILPNDLPFDTDEDLKNNSLLPHLVVKGIKEKYWCMLHSHTEKDVQRMKKDVEGELLGLPDKISKQFQFYYSMPPPNVIYSGVLKVYNNSKLGALVGRKESWT